VTVLLDAGSLSASLTAVSVGIISGVNAGFSSTGIEDNATSTALTIDSSENSTFVGTISVPTMTGVYFDGGSDTYIRESSANTMQLVAGGIGAVQFQSATATFNGSLVAGTTINFGNSGTGGLLQSKKNDGTTVTLMQLFTDDKLYIDSPLDIRLRTNGSTDALTIDSSQNATFAGTVNGRTLATDGAKLDGIYSGRVITSPTSGTVGGASGFTYSTTSGACTITHNLGTTNYTVIATVTHDATKKYIVGYGTIGTNSCVINTINTLTGNAGSASFHFMLVLD
jgi:hypothetical protein